MSDAGEGPGKSGVVSTAASVVNAAEASAEARLRLSVIVPARNEEAVLRECLRSLVEQSDVGFVLGVEWELIVVDDDSTDGTREIAREMEREGVVAIAAPSAGPERARRIYRQDECVLGGGAAGARGVAAVYRCGHGA